MPFVSKAQQGYMNANRAKIGGKTVDEFNQASKGMKLPARAPEKKGIGHKLAALKG